MWRSRQAPAVRREASRSPKSCSFALHDACHDPKHITIIICNVNRVSEHFACGRAYPRRFLRPLRIEGRPDGAGVRAFFGAIEAAVRSSPKRASDDALGE